MGLEKVFREWCWWWWRGDIGQSCVIFVSAVLLA